VLYGSIESATASSTDLDNALLYNIGGSLSPATRNGVVLERRAADGVGVRYRYHLALPEQFSSGSGDVVIAELSGIALRRAPQSWLEVWLACRASPALRTIRSAPTGDLALRLRIGAPRFASSASAQFVKTVVDGVFTALHAQGDGETVDRVAELMAKRLGARTDEIARLLRDDANAVLGVRSGLVALRGDGIQCWPDDRRLAAISITLDRSAPSWSLSGRVALIEGTQGAGAS
jgi:hypothetical protein